MILNQYSFLTPRYYSSDIVTESYVEMDTDICATDVFPGEDALNNYGHVPDGEVIRLSFDTASKPTGKSIPIHYFY